MGIIEAVPHPDDERLARASRAIRREQGLRQRDLVAKGRSRELVMRIENCGAPDVRLRDLREHFARLGARVRVTAWWNGADLDRLLDHRHAGLIEIAVRRLQGAGWCVATEVTFSEFGERGSLDILAAWEDNRTVLVGEVKSAWGSMEETNRSLDAKVRLAPQISRQRFGWTPAGVGRLLILPEDATARRIARAHSVTLAAAYPARNREIHRWVHRPDGPLAGLWFLSDVVRKQRRAGQDGPKAAGAGKGDIKSRQIATNDRADAPRC